MGEEAAVTKKRNSSLVAMFAQGAKVHQQRSGAMLFTNLSREDQLTVLWAEKGMSHSLIDARKFRTIFGSNIPPGFHRKDITHRTKDFRTRLQAKVKDRVGGKFGTLAFDGWKHLEDHNVNTVMLCRGAAFYVSSDVVNHQDVVSLTALFKKKAKLAKAMYNFFAIAGNADNAHAFQAALRNCTQKDDDDPDFDPFLSAERCCMHALALVMKDFTALNPIKIACEVLDELIDWFSDADLRDKLRNVQTAAGVPPVRLLKPVATRIGVKCTCFVRMLMLRTYIDLTLEGVEVSTAWVSTAKWTAVEHSAMILKPYCKQIGVVESDRATLWDKYKGFQSLEKHVDELQTTEGVKTFGRHAKTLMGDRWAAQFDSPSVRAVAFCSPERVRKGEPVPDALRTVRWICEFGVELYQREGKEQPRRDDGEPGLSDVLRGCCASFAVQEGVYDELDYTLQYEQFWHIASLVDPYLPPVVKNGLLAISPTEASVHRPDRNKLARDTLDATMFVGVNYPLMFADEEATADTVEL